MLDDRSDSADICSNRGQPEGARLTVNNTICFLLAGHKEKRRLRIQLIQKLLMLWIILHHAAMNDDASRGCGHTWPATDNVQLGVRRFAANELKSCENFLTSFSFPIVADKQQYERFRSPPLVGR